MKEESQISGQEKIKVPLFFKQTVKLILLLGCGLVYFTLIFFIWVYMRLRTLRLSSVK